MTTKFEQAAKLREEYRAVLKSVTPEDVHDLLKPAFEKYPDIRVIYWNQWIPAFNDGDPCEFIRGESDILVESPDNPHLDKLSETEIHAKSTNSLCDYRGELSDEIVDAVWEGMKHLSDEVAEAVFGSGAQVIVTKNRISYKPYNCGY